MAQSYGIKVSEPGFNVHTASEKNLSLKSGMTLLKVFDSGELTLSSTWNEVTHDLGYVPHYLVCVKDTTTNPEKTFLATANMNTAIARADTTKLYIKKSNANQGTAYYYIFYEPTDTGTSPTINPTSDYGIKVSKDGVDVNTANILEQTFNSEKNSLKIITEDTVSSTARGSRTLTVAHGLGVVPAFFLFYQVDNSSEWYPTSTQEDSSGKNVVVIGWTDSTNLKIDINSDSSAIVEVKYYILVDKGQ